MPFIQLSLTCLEDNYMHIVKCCKHAICLLLRIVQHISYYTLTRTHTHTHTHTHTYIHTYDSTKRILAYVTVSRKERAIAQTRELEATKAVLPQVLEQGGILHACEHLLLVFMVTMYMCVYTDLKIMKVAHDNATSVKSYITKDLHLLNSYDTWHGGLTYWLPDNSDNH